MQQYSIFTLYVNMNGSITQPAACSAEGSLYSHLCQLKLEDVCLFKKKTAVSKHSTILTDCSY